MSFASSVAVRRAMAESFAPPEPISVFDSIDRLLVTKDGPYEASLTPYMREPANMLNSRTYKTVCFLGPGRTGKTVTLIDGWVARNVRYAPGDMLIVQSSQDQSRYYSNFRIGPMIQNSPEIRERLSARKQDDNTYDKVFKNGMVLAFGHPSSSQGAGRDFRYVAITEYDSASEDVDNEGSLFALFGKRVTTYLSAGKILVESSVRREYADQNWRRKVPHEAPPATGITGIYNGGTMAWLAWECNHCGAWLDLDPDVHVMFDLPPIKELLTELDGVDPSEWARDHAKIKCRACEYEFDQSDKRKLNQSALWIPSGCDIEDGVVVGDPRDTDIASFQLSSVAAAYQSWDEILQAYAVAIQDFARTGSEVAIKSTVNLDQGRAYLPMAVGRTQSNEELKKVAFDWPYGFVPGWVRFLIATVDVQKRGFIVQVFGISPDRMAHWEWTIVDRFEITESTRINAMGQKEPVNPSAYEEDWDLLESQVMRKRYVLNERRGFEMPIVFTAIDSGGAAKRGSFTGVKEGVTEKAYAWWRRVNAAGFGRNLRLVKGSGNTDKRVEERRPHTAKDKSDGISLGDVPVLFVATDVMKDGLSMDLARAVEGNGGCRWASWLPAAVLSEMTAETRTAKGWVKPSGVPNEATDLAVYCRAVCIHLGLERTTFWEDPPAWATERMLIETGNNPAPLRKPQQRRRAVRSSGVSV